MTLLEFGPGVLACGVARRRRLPENDPDGPPVASKATGGWSVEDAAVVKAINSSGIIKWSRCRIGPVFNH